MYNLYLVYVGGRSNESNVESHDIIFTVGDKISNTHEQIISKWRGEKDGLHIDSYSTINFIDGYKIVIKDYSREYNKMKKKPNLYLWFVYIGGYEKDQIQESHQLILVVSKSITLARKKAKEKACKQFKMTHIDNIKKLFIIGSDNKNSNSWLVTLEEDPLNRSQDIIADWQGYKRLI